jgi:hypothetical protein
MTNVFISYDASEDTAFAGKLASDLRRHALDVWIAPEGIRAGESFIEAINRGLSRSAHFLLIVTRSALASP